MVLLPGCVCCPTKCQSLAQRIIDADSVQLDFSVTSYDRTRVGTVSHQCQFLTFPFAEDMCGYPVGSTFGSREVCRGQDFSGTFSLVKFNNFKDNIGAFTAFKYTFPGGTSVVIEASSPMVGGRYSLSQIRVGGNARGIIQFDRSSSSPAAPALYSNSGQVCNCSINDATPVSRKTFLLIPLGFTEFVLVDFFEANGLMFDCDDSFSFDSVTASAVANGYSDRTDTTFPLAENGFRRAGFDDEPDSAPQTTISFSKLVVP